MKRPLYLLLSLSLLANAVLGWMAWRSELGNGAISAPSDGAKMPWIPPVMTGSSSTGSLVETHRSPTPAVIDWHSLEAPDFATYIANLRRAGCPEATIRHLIEPELHAVFEERRQNPAAHPAQPSSAADEAATLAALLDVHEAEKPAANLFSTSALPSIPAAFLVGNASAHAVFQDENLSLTPTDASLAPETLQTLADMRRQFGDQVTSSGSDPSSRDYYIQWLKAQRMSDDYFASLYGGDHFISVQQQANLQRSQNVPGSAAQVTKSSN